MPLDISILDARCGNAPDVISRRFLRSGISSEANIVTDRMDELARYNRYSHALYGERADALTQLWEMVGECLAANWDGEGADPITLEAFQNASNFIARLPQGFPLPEFAPEPDGWISLDWIASRHRMYSLSIGADNRLAYAWKDGTDRGRGVVHFDGYTVPPRVLSEIQLIAGKKDARFRPA